MSKNIRKKIVALAMMLSTVLATMPVTAFAAENNSGKTNETATVASVQPTITITKISDEVEDVSSARSKDYVNRAGALNAGASISGTFTLTGWFGNNFNVIACGGNTGGSLSLSLVSARYDIPCDGTARVICRETGWSRGTYSYSIYNGTGRQTSYSLNIYEP